MVDQPLISVLMNCHNSDEFLEESINSVYNQSYSNWEIIFYDNNSTDESKKIANSYDSKLKYFYSQKKVALGKARHFASLEASGKYLAFLDCDDIWYENNLSKLKYLNAAQESIDVVSQYLNEKSAQIGINYHYVNLSIAYFKQRKFFNGLKIIFKKKILLLFVRKLFLKIYF